MRPVLRGDYYDNRIVDLFVVILEDYEEEIEESGLGFDGWLWKNRDILGELIYQDISDYMGIDIAIKKAKGFLAE